MSEEKRLIDLSDTEIATYNTIDTLKSVLRLYKKKLHEALNELEPLVIECYKQKKIDFNTNTQKLKEVKVVVTEGWN